MQLQPSLFRDWKSLVRQVPSLVSPILILKKNKELV